MRKNIIYLLLIGICITIFLSGCGKLKQSQNVQTEASNSPLPTETIAPTPTPVEIKELKVDLYYGDETGDHVVKREQTLKYTADTSKYIAVLNALKVSPDSKAICLFTGFKFFTADLNNGGLTINLTFPKESILGAPGEELLLDSLQKTIFQFPEVKTLDVLVDGKKVDSLMGHMDLPHPFKK
ncbi:MAG: GerMN lipoprotein LpqB [Bacilli bacterium]|nr:GerMN lipoprotein LpqB [Bacilli bacterium]